MRVFGQGLILGGIATRVYAVADECDLSGRDHGRRVHRDGPRCVSRNSGLFDFDPLLLVLLV